MRSWKVATIGREAVKGRLLRSGHRLSSDVHNLHLRRRANRDLEHEGERDVPETKGQALHSKRTGTISMYPTPRPTTTSPPTQRLP